MGSTWLRKLHSNGRLMPETTTLAVAVFSPTLAVIVVWPSCAGTTRPSTTVATLGSLEDHEIFSVTWRPASSRSSSCKIRCCRLSRRAQLARRGNNVRRSAAVPSPGDSAARSMEKTTACRVMIGGPRQQ